jgi:IS30 family transposase
MCALSTAFCGEPVRSITTDNDIAFACWKDIESLLQAPLYFTHPYHSWEKGLVENTNRWIRCFAPKKRDIAFVTEKELYDIHSFLNNRPRKIIGFRVPRVYHEGIRVLLRG